MTTTTNETTLNEAGAQLDDGRTIEGGITEVKAPSNELVMLDPVRFATELFQPFHDELATEKRKRRNYDITTKEGMAKAVEAKTTFQKIRTRADKAKTTAKKPIDQAGKEILERFKTLATAAQAEEKKHADAIEAEEKRLADIAAEKQRLERARIEAIEGRIEHIRLIPSTLAKASAADIEAKLDELVATTLAQADYEEHLELAITTQNTAINELRQLLADARAAEAAAARLKELEAAEEVRKAAAAAVAAQQQQMLDIMGIQNLAAELVANERDKDRMYVEAALAKAKAFDPATFGAMAPMAALARTAALPPLEAMLAALPAEADPAAVEEAASLLETELEARNEVVLTDLGDGPDLSQLEPAAPMRRGGGGSLSAGSGFYPGRTIPKPARPTDVAILEALAAHFGVPALVAVEWLETVDTVQLRADLKAA